VLACKAVALSSLVCHSAEFESDALLPWHPVELSAWTHYIDHGGRRRASRVERMTDWDCKAVEQAQRSIGRNTVTIIQSTVDHRMDEHVRRVTRQ